jgi:H2-forming N5,N10-methylenetetrahydromethanopterin dehydrogenase-like enzyme
MNQWEVAKSCYIHILEMWEEEIRTNKAEIDQVRLVEAQNMFKYVKELFLKKECDAEVQRIEQFFQYINYNDK